MKLMQPCKKVKCKDYKICPHAVLHEKNPWCTEYGMVVLGVKV